MSRFIRFFFTFKAPLLKLSAKVLSDSVLKIREATLAGVNKILQIFLDKNND